MHRSPTIHTTAEDAVCIYTLTIAYLFNARIGGPSSASTLRVKERSGNTFYIWRREFSEVTEEPIVPATLTAPVAVCSHKKGTKLWRVKLISGEELTLLDKGDVWDIVWDADIPPLAFIKKRQGRSRTRGNQRM